MPDLLSRRLTAALLLSVAWMLGGRVDAVAAQGWRPPVRGAVVAGFRFDPQRPYARGARRGATFATAPGVAVRAACAGPVTFAGPLPGAGGAGVTVACGELVATHLGLTALRVRRGATVGAGAVLAVAAGRLVRLGARRAGERHGYVDPLTLFGVAAPRSRPLVPPPALGRAPRAPGRPPGEARRVHLRSRRGSQPLQEPGGAVVPDVAWLGLGLLALGIPGGVWERRVRARRRAASDVAAARAMLGRGW